MMMIAPTTITAMIESFATAYGKNGLPAALCRAYSRRYCSFSRWFMRSDLVRAQLGVVRDLQPRGSGGAELGHQVQVEAHHRRDRAGHEQHVDRVEPRQGDGAELRAAAQE